MSPPGDESTALVEPDTTSLYARRRVYVILIAPFFAGFMYGYSIGGISGSVSSLDTMLHRNTQQSMTVMQQSALTSASITGALTASIFCFYAGDFLGRRKELIFGASYYLLGTVVSELSMGVVEIVYVGRWIFGVGIGFSMHAAPLYIAEVSPSDVRGTLIAMKEGFIVLGMVVGYGMLAVSDNFISEELTWRVVWAVPVIFASMILIVMKNAPPSPRWLVLKGQVAEARVALRWLIPSRTDEMVAREVEEIQSMLRELPTEPGTGADGGVLECGPISVTERAEWVQLCKARRPLLYGVGLIVLQQVTGQPTVLYYAQSIFMAAGMDPSAAKDSDLLVASAKLVATLVAVPLVDRLGRRPLLMAGVSLMIVALTLLTVAFAVTGDDVKDSPGWGPVIVVGLMLYVSAYQVGFGPVTWVLIGELFPLRSRTRALGMAVVVNFAINLTVTLSEATLADTFGQAALFGFYGLMCVVALAFIVGQIPETKGKSLEQIESMLAALDNRPAKTSAANEGSWEDTHR